MLQGVLSGLAPDCSLVPRSFRQRSVLLTMRLALLPLTSSWASSCRTIIILSSFRLRLALASRLACWKAVLTSCRRLNSMAASSLSTSASFWAWDTFLAGCKGNKGQSLGLSESGVDPMGSSAVDR